MIIVSQDKTQIFNFDNINYLQMGKNFDNDFAVEINYSDCNYNVIARYKTEKRAKEVLQEILKQKAMFELYRLLPTGGREQTEMLERFVQKRIILDTYEMPEE